MSDAHIVARDQLRAFIERIERLEEEKKSIADDIKDVYGEAKGTGFDTKVLRKLISIRKQDREERMEQEAILDMYMIALGMVDEPAGYDEPRQSEPVERQPAVALRSDGGLSILTKHEDIRTAPVTAEEIHANPEEVGARDETVSAPAVDAGSRPVAGRSATATSEIMDVTGGESAATSSDHSSEGGADEVDGSAPCAGIVPTSNTGEGAANTALPADSVKLEYVPPTGMKRLPVAHCFPELSKAEYERLEKDIVANRVREPIIRQGDVIVDGWARYNISRAYGMSYPVQEIDNGHDVLLDVIEWQRASRKFTPAQEKKIAADLAKEIPHRADDIMSAFGLAEALEAAE